MMRVESGRAGRGERGCGAVGGEVEAECVVTSEDDTCDG